MKPDEKPYSIKKPKVDTRTGEKESKIKAILLT